MTLLTNRRTRGLLVASAAVVAGAVAAPAASAYTSVSIYDGVPRGDYSGNSVAGWSTNGPTTLEILRGGAVVASASDMGWTDFDIAAGDVVRLVDASTGATVVEVPYAGKPAVTTCAGSTTFQVAADAGETHVAAFPDETVERYSAGDFGYLRGEVDATAAGTFTGAWESALPASAVVSATTYGATGSGNDQTVTYTSVERRVADLCPKPEAPKPPVTTPVTTPVAPGKPAAVTPKQLAKQLLESTIETFRELGLAGVTKTQNVPVTVTGPGTVQIQQFSGSAPKKVTVYAAAAKKKKAAKKATAPKNLIASGERTFTKAGAGAVKVKPTKRAKAAVKGKKRLSVTVRVVFQPKGGKPVAQDRKITLKRGK